MLLIQDDTYSRLKHYSYLIYSKSYLEKLFRKAMVSIMNGKAFLHRKKNFMVKYIQ